MSEALITVPRAVRFWGLESADNILLRPLSRSRSSSFTDVEQAAMAEMIDQRQSGKRLS